MKLVWICCTPMASEFEVTPHVEPTPLTRTKLQRPHGTAASSRTGLYQHVYGMLLLVECIFIRKVTTRIQPKSIKKPFKLLCETYDMYSNSQGQDWSFSFYINPYFECQTRGLDSSFIVGTKPGYLLPSHRQARTHIPAQHLSLRILLYLPRRAAHIR